MKDSMQQFMTGFIAGLVFLAPVAIMAQAANGQEITPQSIVDCNQVQCTTDGAELPPPPECIEELERTGFCIGEAWTLSE
jgi:hypothetical protein